MKPDCQDEMYISPKLREVWRPFYVLGPMATLAILAGFIASAAGERDGLGVGLFVAAILLLFAAVRSLVWRLIPGSTCIVCTPDSLDIRRFGKVVRKHPWGRVEGVYLEPGDRWPEWARWAQFARLQVALRGEGYVSSPSILIVRFSDVDAAREVIEEQLVKHVGGNNFHRRDGG